MENKIDIVYITSEDSNLLKYSLRSIERNVIDYGDIYIIGACPEINKDKVRCLPVINHFDSPCRNILSKILIACEMPYLSDEFIVIYDDYFFTKKVSFVNYPHYHSESLFNYTLNVGFNNPYKENLINTYDYLIDLVDLSIRMKKEIKCWEDGNDTS